jgi:hypothetical protein
MKRMNDHMKKRDGMRSSIDGLPKAEGGRKGGTKMMMVLSYPSVYDCIVPTLRL